MQDTFNLENKVIAITGASSGFGHHFAGVLAANGAKVILGARRREKLNTAVKEIKAAGGSATAATLDVTDKASIESFLDVAYTEFGRLDCVINNAGVEAGAKTYHTTDEEDWDFVLDTNLKAAWRVAQSVANQAITRQRPCSIINIASILGLRVTFGESTYSTSKAGLIQLTKAMAMELARKGVRVNAICPGYFETEMNSDYLNSEAGKKFMGATPSGRHGQLEELSAPLLLLASDAGSYINGVALPVDGGHIASPI